MMTHVRDARLGAARRRHSAAIVALLTIALAACTTDEADTTASTAPATSATVSPTTTAPPATTPTTTPITSAPVTTAPAVTGAPIPAPAATAPATTAAPGTTAALTPTDLALLSDGIGPLRFGDAEADAVRVLTSVLGPPADTATATYPVPVDGAYAIDEFGEERFAHPASSTVCFDNGLCVVFGGPAADSLTLTGWAQDADPGSLATPEGITVGSRWSDHLAAMTVDEGGCYSSGSGTTAGIYLWVLSEGVPFLEVLADGTSVNRVPDPADVVVTRLESGDMPYMPFLDC